MIHYPDDSANPLANFKAKTLEDGWHHSIVDKKEAVSTFSAKAHISVNFRRLRADGAEIDAYFSLYIITEIDGHWGIQGGSGTGT